MGVFDYIRCEAPLPGGSHPDVFQTKDTPDQYLSDYTIKPDGRLMWRPYTYETVPAEERPDPRHPMMGARRRVYAEEEVVPFDGPLEFYGGADRFLAVFIGGQLPAPIERIPTHIEAA